MNGFRLSGSCTMPMCSVSLSPGEGLEEAAARATPTAAASTSSRVRTIDALTSGPACRVRAVMLFPLVRMDRRRQAPLPCEPTIWTGRGGVKGRRGCLPLHSAR